MRQKEVMIGGICEIMINGTLCKVRVTGKREVSSFGTRRTKTVFDWTRLDPPAGAKKLSGYDTAAKLRPVRTTS